MGIRNPSLKKEILAILVVKLALIVTIKVLYFSAPADQGAAAIEQQFLSAKPSTSKEADNDR
ncbi:hypothetical protein PVT67_05385 [Gallaecimonas kandeliae]|uniref:cytochrome oxidase putative small subunit CydP n=1 Tax=Gallaecimonas kandeliae TaxID=3029055 RepID=UPI0026486A0A|nr:cytochrome oxidase putative small subunit CydP [Gallaecimonas kandeliae]WKE66678.1 hypothetical protein PVT67_05385 [Gallaecimonas kandeliae]